MATQEAMSVADYLATSWTPDREYVAGRRPKERIASEVLIVAIEILSPDDKMCDMVARLRPDPESRDMWVFGDNGLHSVDQFDFPQFAVSYSKKEIFAD